MPKISIKLLSLSINHIKREKQSNWLCGIKLQVTHFEKNWIYLEKFE